MVPPSLPATRVLAMLELLQTYGRLGGPDLARRLGVGERTIRRYMLLLEELGIPVEAGRGRYGGYRLRPGFKLPPLMFSEDEALALVLGLLFVRQTGITGAPADAAGALAKVERVMPDSLRARVRAVQEAVVLTGGARRAGPAAAMIGILSEAAHRRQCVRLRYRAAGGAETTRLVDVYGVVCLAGTWYAAAFDHLRSAMRTFRIDRVQEAQLRDRTFTSPDSFDALAYVQHALATTPGQLAVEVLLETTFAEARQLVPPAMATLEETSDGVVMRYSANDRRDLAWLAHVLAGLECPLLVRTPPELRDELRRLAAHTLELANRL